MPYSHLVLLIGLLVLQGCHANKPKTFLEQRSQHNWHLPGHAFTGSSHWNDAVTGLLSHGECPAYLSEYMNNSSDIIDDNHVFPYSAFGLTDDCMQRLVMFMQFYMQQYAETVEQPRFTLDISQNPELSNRSVAYVLELLHGTDDIVRVNLRGNPRISEDALEVLRHEGNVLVDS